MKISTYRSAASDEAWAGAIDPSGNIVQLDRAALAAAIPFPGQVSGAVVSVRDILGEGKDGVAWVSRVVDAATAEHRIASDAVRALFPVPDLEKFIGIGLNYRDHAEEQGAKIPRQPIAFAKFRNALIGPNDPIRMPTSSTDLDYEAELGVVIGRRGRDIRVEDALDHVGGYCVVNDVTARDVQLAERQWVRGKTFDATTPAGPYITTPDEVADPMNLPVRLWINDVVFQDGNTSDMIFGVAELIAHVSQDVTLEPGDLIATGTPAGVGFVRQPPVYLTRGDRVRVEVGGLGSIDNLVE